MGTMKNWAIDGYGRDHLKLTDVPVPELRQGEVLVKVKAFALNARDPMMIANGMGSELAFPFVPGSDMAGVVESIGTGVERFAVGDRVISNFMPGWIDGLPAGNARIPSYNAMGGYYPGIMSEYVALPAEWLSTAPASLDDGEASTLPVAGLTAWFALIERGRLRAGEVVLVQGTGGVALFGMQIAKAHGATVIITSSSEEKLARAKSLGADHGINRNTGDWVEEVYRLTGDRGADHILELAGGSNLGKSVAAVAVEGNISIIGLMDGFELSAPTVAILLKAPTIQGIVVGHRRALEELVRAIDNVGLKPVIDRRFAFADLPAAFDHLDQGPFGKVVVELS